MTAWPIEKEGHPAPSKTHPDTNPLRQRRHPRYPPLMQHEIPNFDVDVNPIPIPRDFALQACTLRIDDRARSSPPDSRRLFITGANSGTKSWYLEQRHQLRPPRRNNLPAPGEQQGPAATQAEFKRGARCASVIWQHRRSRTGRQSSKPAGSLTPPRRVRRQVIPQPYGTIGTCSALTPRPNKHGERIEMRTTRLFLALFAFALLLPLLLACSRSDEPADGPSSEPTTAKEEGVFWIFEEEGVSWVFEKTRLISRYPLRELGARNLSPLLVAPDFRLCPARPAFHRLPHPQVPPVRRPLRRLPPKCPRV